MDLRSTSIASMVIYFVLQTTVTFAVCYALLHDFFGKGVLDRRSRESYQSDICRFTACCYTWL